MSPGRSVSGVSQAEAEIDAFLDQHRSEIEAGNSVTITEGKFWSTLDDKKLRALLARYRREGGLTVSYYDEPGQELRIVFARQS